MAVTGNNWLPTPAIIMCASFRSSYIGPEAISLIPKCSVSGEELPAYGVAGNEASEAIYFLTHSSRVKMKVCSVCHQVPYIDLGWDWNKERESVCLILQTPHTAVFRPANIQKSLAGYF